MKRGGIIIGQLATCLLTSVTLSGNAEDMAFKRDSYLVLDSRIIEKTENAQLAIGVVRKDKHNPLFGEDQPWEKRFDDHPVFLGDEIRIYYGGSDGKHTGWRNGFFCLATLTPDHWAGYEPIGPNQVDRFDGKTLAGWPAVPEESASDWSVLPGELLGWIDSFHAPLPTQPNLQFDPTPKRSGKGRKNS